MQYCTIIQVISNLINKFNLIRSFEKIGVNNILTEFKVRDNLFMRVRTDVVDVSDRSIVRTQRVEQIYEDFL